MTPIAKVGFGLAIMLGVILLGAASPALAQGPYENPAELRECVVSSGAQLGVVTTRDLDAMAVTDYEARVPRCLRHLYRMHGRQPR